MKSGKSKEGDAEKIGDDAQVGSSKDTSVTPPTEKHEPSDGSEKVEPKKGKSKKEKGEKGSGKGRNPKSGKADVKAPEPESLEGKPKKRKAGSEKIPAATFARRVCPKSSYGKCKWEALKNAFSDIVKPHLTHYSAHEEGLKKLVGWGAGSITLFACNLFPWVLLRKNFNMYCATPST